MPDVIDDAFSPDDDDVLLDEVDEVDEIQTEDDAAESEQDDDVAPAADDDDAPAAAAPRQQSRAEQRIVALRKREKEAASERDRHRAEADDLRRQLNLHNLGLSEAQRAAAERVEQERMALMDPDQRTQYLLGRQGQQFQSQINELRFQTWDASDKVKFDGMASRSPALASVADEVERVLAAERAAGRSGANRETIAAYVIGQRALARAGRAKAKQSKTGRERLAQQSARPAGGSSDVAAPGRKGGRDDSIEALERRLRGVKV